MFELAANDPARQQAIREAIASKRPAVRIAADLGLPLNFIEDARAELRKIREQARRKLMADQHRKYTRHYDPGVGGIFADFMDTSYASKREAEVRKWVLHGKALGLRYGRDARSYTTGHYVANLLKAPWRAVAPSAGVSAIYDERGTNLHRGAK